MMELVAGASVPDAIPSPVVLPRRVIVLTASKASLPDVEG